MAQRIIGMMRDKPSAINVWMIIAGLTVDLLADYIVSYSENRPCGYDLRWS